MQSARDSKHWLAVARRFVGNRQALFGSMATGALAGALAGMVWPGTLAPVTQALMGWNVFCLLYFGWLYLLLGQASHASIRQRAAQLDEGQRIILGLAVVAALACLGAIVAELGVAKNFQGAAKGWHIALAGGTVVTAWLFVHLMFATHYAHTYYLPGPPGADGKKDRGGLAFPGDEAPTYSDFLYFSFIIGTAAQTADVSITDRHLRRVSLIHALIAFVFNTMLVALTINLAAGLF